VKCERCGEQLIKRGDWPGCPCDQETGLMLTVHEAARCICVSRSTVYDFIATGLLVANRASRPMRIPMTSIKALWAAESRDWRLRQGIYRDR
jgi:excisionase family DNA binding protein